MFFEGANKHLILNFSVECGSLASNHLKHDRRHANDAETNAEVRHELVRQLGVDLVPVSNVVLLPHELVPVLVEPPAGRADAEGLEDGSGGHEHDASDGHTEKGVSVLFVGGPQNGVWR